MTTTKEDGMTKYGTVGTTLARTHGHTIAAAIREYGARVSPTGGYPRATASTVAAFRVGFVRECLTMGAHDATIPAAGRIAVQAALNALPEGVA